MADEPLSKKDTHDKYFASKGSLIFVSSVSLLGSRLIDYSILVKQEKILSQVYTPLHKLNVLQTF